MQRFISTCLLYAALTAWGGCSERVVIGELIDGGRNNLGAGEEDYCRPSNEESDDDLDAGVDTGAPDEEPLVCDPDFLVPDFKSAPIWAIWGSYSQEFGKWYWDMYAVGGSDDVRNGKPKGLVFRLRDSLTYPINKDWEDITYFVLDVAEPVYGVWSAEIDVAPYWSHDVLLVHGAGAHRYRLTDANRRTGEWKEETELEDIFDTEDRPKLTAVYGTSTDNIYVVGSKKWTTEGVFGGNIAHYDGTKWSAAEIEDPRLKAEIDRAWLTDVWADSQTGRVYVVSSEASELQRKGLFGITIARNWASIPSSQGAIYEYDGLRWSKVFPTRIIGNVKYYFFGVWGREGKDGNPGEVFVVGTRREGARPPYTSRLVILSKRQGESAWYHEEEELPDKSILSPAENALITGAGISGDEDHIYVVGSRVQVEYKVDTFDGGIEGAGEKRDAGPERYSYKGQPKGFMIHNNEDDEWKYVRYTGNDRDPDDNGAFPFGLLDIWFYSGPFTALYFAGTDRIVACVDLGVQ